jgi:hypothetical protein
MRQMRQLARSHTCASFVCFVLTLSAVAQVQNGQITGVISDPSGAIIPQASVQVRNLATGYEVDLPSNNSGSYRCQS